MNQIKLFIRRAVQGAHDESGASLLLTVLILAYVFAIALILASIVVLELKLVGNSVNSTISIYAADAGIEKSLYTVRKTNYAQYYTSLSFCNQMGNIVGGAPQYSVSGTLSTTSGGTTINSIGSFPAASTTCGSVGATTTQRGLQVTF